MLNCFNIFSSCSENDPKEQILRIMNEWVGKTIVFPEGIEEYSINKTKKVNADYEYKILLYTDSVGCTSCKLKLPIWKEYIKELDSIANGRVEFLFYFQPKKERELVYLLKQSGLNYPVYLDIKGEINKKNKFPSQMEFQCYLLDKENKVVSIGNPVLNPKVWELYKSTITGKQVSNRAPTTTTIAIEHAEKDFGKLKLGDIAQTSFVLRNTGKHPLIISNVDASCGCTTPKWDKIPINPNEETSINVEIKPDEAGFFNKTIHVYANTESRIIPLKIKGMVSK